MSKNSKKHWFRMVAFLLVTVMGVSSVLGTLAYAANRVTIMPRENRGLDYRTLNYLASRVTTADQSFFTRMRGVASQSIAGFNPLASPLERVYNLAVRYIEQQNFAEALIYVDEFIGMIDGEDTDIHVYADIWLKKGALHILLEQYDEAIGALHKTLEIDPHMADAHLLAAEAHLNNERFEEMIESLEAYVALSPESENFTEDDLFAMREELGLYRERTLALQGIENALHEAITALEAGNFEYAYELIALAFEIMPDYPGLNYFRGVARFGVGDYAGAAYDFRASAESGVFLHESLYNLGISLMLDDNIEDGRVYVEEAAALYDNEEVQALARGLLLLLDINEAARGQLNDMLAQAEEGFDLLSESRYLEAFWAFTEAMDMARAQDVEYHWLHYYRGLARFEARDFAGAAQDFYRSMNHEYMEHASMFNRGVSLISTGDPDAAERGLSYVEMAAALESTAPHYDEDTAFMAVNLISELNAQIERIEQMERESRELIMVMNTEETWQPQWEPPVEEEPDEGVAQLILALEELENEDFAAANLAFTKAIERGYGQEWAEGLHFYRALTRFAMEYFEGAANDFSIAIEQGYMVHSAIYNKGVSLVMLGNIAEGTEYLNLAAAMDDDEEVRAMAGEVMALVLEQVAMAAAQTQAPLENAAVSAAVSPEFEYMMAGLDALRNGEYEEAIGALTNAININRSIPGLFYYRGLAWFELEEFTAAADDFRSSVDNSYLVQSGLYNLAISLIMSGDVDYGLYYLGRVANYDEDEEIALLASDVYERITSSVITLPPVINEMLMGLEYLENSEPAYAEAAFTRALYHDPEYDGLHYYRAVSRFMQGYFAEAAGDFLHSAMKGYQTQNSYFNRGVSLVMAEDFEGGLIYIERAGALYDDESIQAEAIILAAEIKSVLFDIRIAGLLANAQSHGDKGDFAAMAGYLEEYLREIPGDLNVRFAAGQAHFAGDNFHEAIRHMNIILDRGGDYQAQAAYVLGLAALRLSDFHLAGYAFTRAIDAVNSIDREDLTEYRAGIFGAWHYRGVIRMASEDHAAAIEDFTETIVLGQMVQSGYLNRGISRLLTGEREGGIRDLERASVMTDDIILAQQATELIAGLREVNAP